MLSQNDSLVKSQASLALQIDRSHRLFMIHFYGAVLNLVVFAAFTFLLGANLAEEPWEILIYSTPSLVIALSIARHIKTISSFTQMSREALRQIEHLDADSRLLLGVASYANQLCRAIQVLAFRSKPRATPPDNASSQLDTHLFTHAFEFMAYGLTIILTLCLMLLIYPAILAQPPIYALLGIFISSTVIRFVVFLKWRRAISRWHLAYQALFSWEEDLEQSAESAG